MNHRWLLQHTFTSDGSHAVLSDCSIVVHTQIQALLPVGGNGLGEQRIHAGLPHGERNGLLVHSCRKIINIALDISLSKTHHPLHGTNNYWEEGREL